MRFLYFLTAIFAVLLTILVVGLTFVSVIKGGFSVALPGLGLIISGWLVILFLAAIDAAFIFLALLFRRWSEKLS